MKKWLALFLAVLLCVSAGALASSDYDLLGIFGDDIYTNEVMGVRCECPGWDFTPEGDLFAKMGISESMSYDQVRGVMEDGNTHRIMDATSKDYIMNLNVSVQYSASNMSYYRSRGEKGVLEDVVPYLESSLSKSGFTDIVNSVGEITIGGKTVPCLSTTMVSSNGFRMYQKQILLFRGDYMVHVTAISIDEDTTDEIFTHVALLD